ncbi:MAG TPA: hypothetical protein DD671_07170, partial [Balneolaceae bacterium]|nr:hypothetical protein [Balneolaceae bacterium]
ITRRQLRKIIKEAYVSRGSKQEIDDSRFPGYADDVEYEEYNILFPEHSYSPLRKEWEAWFDSLKPGFNNRFNPAIEVRGISYDYPDEKVGYHSAKIRVQGHNLHRFTRPPKDESGFAFIKLMKRE